MSIVNLPPRAPWHSLAGEYYRDERLYQTELASIWRRAWLFAAPACELREPGDYLTLSVDSAPVVLVRDDDRVRAFHNLCTHRGTKLVDDAGGRVGRLIVCPYHQWAFTRGGKLQSCRGMGDAKSAAADLRELPTVEAGGLIFVSLADDPPDAAPLQGAFAAADPHGFDEAKVAVAIDYVVNANWKLIWENNRECYHCTGGHPQYVKANFDAAEGDLASPEKLAALEAVLDRSTEYWESEGLSVKYAAGGLARFPDPDDGNPFPVSATRTVQVEGFETESLDGRRVAPLMGRLQSPEVGVLRLRSLPSFWCHASCDHVVLTRVLPISRKQTATRVTWLVALEALEGVDYDLERLTPFWRMTSEQDWELCERAAAGVASPGYRPGPLSRDHEYNLEAFLTWYEKTAFGSCAGVSQ